MSDTEAGTGIAPGLIGLDVNQTLAKVLGATVPVGGGASRNRRSSRRRPPALPRPDPVGRARAGRNPAATRRVSGTRSRWLSPDQPMATLLPQYSHLTEV
jgi:hypothetical protein